MSSLRLSISTCCLWDWSLDDVLAFYARLGLTRLELIALNMPHIDVDAWTGLRLSEHLAKYGLTLASFYPKPLDTRTPEAIADTIGYCQRAADLAWDAGCRRLVFSPLHFPRETVDFDAIADGCIKIASHFGDRPMQLSLENHHGWPLSTADDYESLFSRMPDPRIGITLDTGHFTSSEVDQTRFIDRWATRIQHVHLKDHIGTESVGFGDGQSPNLAVVEHLRKIGYDGDLVIELELKDKSQLPDTIRAAIPYCRDVLGIVS